MAEADGHTSRMVIQMNETSWDFLVTISLDDTYTFSGTGIWEDPWTMAIQAEDFGGWLFINSSNGDIGLSGVYSSEEEANEILSLFQEGPVFVLLDD